MAQQDLRTYRRRETTRESGYHTCNDTTGGECIVVHAEKHFCMNEIEEFLFYRDKVELVELFERGIAIIAFGGYIYSDEKAEIVFDVAYSYEGSPYGYRMAANKSLEDHSWENIGFHIEHAINKEMFITDVSVKMSVHSADSNTLEFISFDFDAIKKDEFCDTSCAVSFYQKTYMHIPYLYYLDSMKPFSTYLVGDHHFSKGRIVVLKSCNRCGRYLPINIEDEMKTLSFSLHCKKRAPCVHSTFRAYTIQNMNELSAEDLTSLNIENGNKVVSYYGHQLECKACKKFFVNAPLNPQRNAQQFKEDGLRRRAIEVLVNDLLHTNLVHFEFERRTKREFSEYIWKKFNRRCFKCGPDSDPIELSEMALDHTMPLAYLYRLDESATCLCSSHNSQKSDHFPADFYSEAELTRLSEITGLSIEMLHTREVNQEVLDLLVENVVWFYDVFLMDSEYQKVRDGIRTSDKINDSLKRIIAGKVDLAEQYKMKTGHYPCSVTIG